jgi:DNA polymerase-3 subunit epsilon
VGGAAPAGAPDAAAAALAPEDPAADAEDAAWEGMARVLTTTGRYRVLRRFRPRARYTVAQDAQADTLADVTHRIGRPSAPPTALRTALFVDVETTGLDATADAVIEFAAVPFTYSPETGRVHECARVRGTRRPGPAAPARDPRR